MTDEETGRQAKGLSIEELMNLTPRKAMAADVSAFRLDALSIKILDLVDGKRTIREIVEQSGEESRKVLAWLKMLRDAGLVDVSSAGADVQHSGAKTTAGVQERAGPNAHPASTAPSEIPHAAISYSSPLSEKDEYEDEKGPIQGWDKETSGNLAENSAENILDTAVQTNFTGSIHLSRRGEDLTFHFEQGQAIGAQTTAERHDMGYMLWEEGRITVRMVESYRFAMKQGAQTSVEGLRKAGIVDRKVMAKMVSWWGRALIQEAFGWSDGSYAIKPNDPFPPLVVRCRLTVPGKSGSMWRKARLTPDKEAYLEKNRPRYIVPGPRGDMIVMNMGLDDKEMRYVDALFATPMQLSRAMAISPLYRSATKRILSYLIRSGALELREHNPAGGGPISLEELEPFVRHLKSMDHFSVLTAHATSTQEEVFERYQKRIAEFDLSHFSSEATERQLDLINQVRARIEEAYRVLKDPESRRRYRDSIYDAQQLRSFYELQLRKAEIAIRMRMDPKAALLLAKSALEVKPNSSEAKLVLAEAYFMLGNLSEARHNIRQVATVPEHLQDVFRDLKMRIG